MLIGSNFYPNTTFSKKSIPGNIPPCETEDPVLPCFLLSAKKTVAQEKRGWKRCGRDVERLSEEM